MSKKTKPGLKGNYNLLIGDISSLLEYARRTSARVVNTILTATYWEIGRRIVEYEYQGMERVEYYGDRLIDKLVEDLTKQFGRGFSRSNFFLMKSFFLNYNNIVQTLSGQSLITENIVQTLSGKSQIQNILQTPSAQSLLIELSNRFLLPWSHYVRLLSVKDEPARKFYETEAIRSG